MPLLLAHRHLAEGLPAGVPRLFLGDPALGEELPAGAFVPPPIDDAFPAYVIYTSGSTGKPKGVVVPQRAVARLVLGADYLQVQPGDKVGPGRERLVRRRHLRDLGAAPERRLRGRHRQGHPAFAAGPGRRRWPTKGIGAMFLTTALFHQLAEQQPDLLPRFRGLLFGGERCDPALVRSAFESGARGLVHVYGPTEVTTFATSFPLARAAGRGGADRLADRRHHRLRDSAATAAWRRPGCRASSASAARASPTATSAGRP